MKVAHAITAHKIQGQSIKKPLKVALDIASVFDDAQSHVMLSRVEELDQIYILEKLPEEKIRASPKALAELQVMNEKSMNKNPIPWEQENENDIRITFLNIMNLKNNYDDMVKDTTLMRSTIVAVSETWLKTNESLEIMGFKEHLNSVGPGKGIALFIKDDTFQHRSDITEENMQITLIGSNELDVIIVYRSEQGHTLQLIQHLGDLIIPGKAIIICGDFNICYRETRNNRVTKFLNQLGFSQLMKKPTHIRGRTIDHLYFREGSVIQENPIILRYSPYYSDHDAICATIKKTT